jgi:hypothetical protein
VILPTPGRKAVFEKVTIHVRYVGTSAMARPASSAHLSPDELKNLAEAQIARAMQIKKGSERLRVLTVADALMNLAEIKTLLVKYERRLLN